MRLLFKQYNDFIVYLEIDYLRMNKTNEKLYELIFEADTKEGKIFDVTLLIVILISVALVMLESVPTIHQEHHHLLKISEWVITVIFTLEYILRIIIVHKPFKYIFSFYGVIDLLSIIPTFLSLVIVGSQSLIVIRVLRLLRVFRILKLTRYSQAGRSLAKALWASRAKVSVFIFFVIILVVIIGTIMYLVEVDQESGFTSIPRGIYWAIVTLTTVGYGDISPTSAFGQFLASIVMIMGYAILAVPTGIVTAEILRPTKNNTQVCPECLHESHEDDAIFCKKCGVKINP
jgi:voltage-gated potassium channel